MNLIQRSSIVIAILALGFVPGLAQNEVITLMHINDSHSTLAPIGPRGEDLKGTLGGLARVATVVSEERLKNRHLLLLHAGDLFIGDMFFNKYFGVPELQALEQLGFDAMAVGNHEFDLTPAALYQSLETAFPQSGFPLLSANLVLDDPAVQPLKKHIKPYIIKQVGRVKVGIFGLTTPATNLLSLPAPASVDIDVAGIAVSTIEQLKMEDCQVIICLSHLGVQIDRMLAVNVPGIDVIVGGHDHFLFEKPIEVINPAGERTWIVQANAFYLNVGQMMIKVRAGKVQWIQYKMLKIDSSIPEEPRIAASVQELINGIESTYGPVYTARAAYAKEFFEEVATDLTTAGNKDTPVGNLVSDAFKAAAGTDVALAVGGSTAQPLYQGLLVAADFFRALGYGFNTDNGLGYRLATFKMTGSSIYAGLEYGVSDFDQNYDEFLVQASGIKYSYDPALPPFGRVTSVAINGNPLDPGAVYTVTANESVPMVMDLLGIPYFDLTVLPVTEFEAVTAYASQVGTLIPVVEGRVVCAPGSITSKLLAAGAKSRASTSECVPARFALEQNYPNPINPSTTITYSLPIGGRVSLKIFNLIGQEVVALVSGEQGSGVHHVVWNASQLPSGIYLVRLEAASNVAVRKLQLVK